jgi:hypothetical protein
MRRLLAHAIVRLAAIVLPAGERDWGRAMVGEVGSVERQGAAVAYAFGCLAAALRQALSSRRRSIPASEGTSAMPLETKVLRHPRRLAASCAIAATSLGLAYLGAAGAPLTYMATNAAALVIGLLAVGVTTEARRLWPVPSGLVALALASMVMLTSLFGVSADGVTRWISAGGLRLQPGLFIVPIVALGFARDRNPASLLAVLSTALALALQPDRAMAGALAAGMAVLAVVRPERTVLAALGGTLAAFTATLVRADASAAMPFVDQIFYSSFRVHPLAGLAVLAGAVLMLVPAAAGYVCDPRHRSNYAVFGAVWLAVIVAAALGNYPTPLVGYSGSAIVGYVLCLLGLPSGPVVESRGRTHAETQFEAEEQQLDLRARLPATG